MPPCSLKLLLVDDDEWIHGSLEKTLHREPYELIHAYDGEAALCVLEEHRDVRAMICDQNMPGMKGMELIVQTRLRFPHVAVLLLTGAATVELTTVAVNEGRIQGFLTKPWDAAVLRRTIAELVRPEAGPPSPEELAVELVERQLRDELDDGRRDPETGAFLLDENPL